MKKPLVSVILPVFNNALYLREAVESILNQTYDNFEFIIINDGSKDNSAEIIQSFNDPRIKFFDQANQGLAKTLNRGISLAQGDYIARQDGDDISLPKRLEKQVEFLENHPNYALVGTWAVIWEETKETERLHKHPSENAVLKFELLFDNPFVHSSVMIRKAVFEKVGLYCSEKTRQPEDYELWSRIAREYEVTNLPEVLHVYREAKGSMCRTGENPYLDRVVNLSAENFAWVLGKSKLDQDISNLAALAHRAFHRLSPRPNYPEISRIILEAVEIISNVTDTPSNLILEESNAQLRRIRSNYLQYRFGVLLGWVLFRVERVLKGESRIIKNIMGKP